MDRKQIARIRADLYALPGGPFTLEPVGIARNELRQLLNALGDLEAARDVYQARMNEAIKVLKG
jgi:hypothetical protein